MNSRAFRWVIAATIVMIAVFLAVQVWTTRLGLYRYKTGDTKGAAHILKIAHYLNPFTTSVNNALADIYIQEGETEKAEGLLKKSIAHNPDDALAHDLLGVALQTKGLFKEAMAEYDAAIQLDPKFAVAYFNRGYLLMRNGDVPKGIAEISKAVGLMPALAKNRDDVFKRMNFAPPPAPTGFSAEGENKNPTGFSK